MPSSTDKLPAHEIAYRRLRDAILFGDFAPGQAVTIHGLVDELNVSMTPVREAIRRLTAEGALEFQGNRRISVPVIGKQRFVELAYARLSIEPKLAKIATKNITKKQILELRTIDDSLNQAIEQGDIKSYMRCNHQFHFTLYGHANSAILLPIAKTLWLRFGPLYRIISGKYGTSNLIDQHDEAINALTAGKSEAVSEAIRSDIEQGLEIVRDEFEATTI